MSTSSTSGGVDHHCPYWRKGYCVAETGCKLRHDPAEGGQFQESYMAQVRGYHAVMPMATAYPVNPSQLASAVYGGQMPMGYGYGYYGQMIPPQASAPVESLAPPRNYKTVQCRHFLRGHCLRGSACGFRHGDEEPTEEQSASFGQLPAELSNPIHPGRLFRVTTCKRWVQGNCNMGDRCTFRHDFEGPNNNVQYYSGMKRSLSPDRDNNMTSQSRDETRATTPATADELISPNDRDATKLQKT